MLPFKEDLLTQNVYIRTFTSDTPEQDLKWHWDEEDRVIEPISTTDWLFQFDNQLPVKIDGKIFIPMGVIHRLIKGTFDLKIKVTKNESKI